MTTGGGEIDPADYCREIEAYLCRKNEGHLIRIVGPAFEQVCGWAVRGVPLRIACRGIDRYCERYYARGPQRRPVRIEFCEADVLDAFDEWRRAVGVTGPAAGASFAAEEEGSSSRKPSLAAHIERAAARLAARPAQGSGSAAFEQAVAEALHELDGLAGAARRARGDTRSLIVDRLAELDTDLIAAARAAAGPRAPELRREAEAEMAPFGARMAPAERARAVDAAFDRLVREAQGLPVLTFE